MYQIPLARVIMLTILLWWTFQVSSCSKLVVILMDGFRWDYFDHVQMPGFSAMARDGVKVEYMESDYPTLSYPNYYSIMTGLHCESHGMVGNYMYDVQRDKNFLIGYNPDQSLPFWWDDAEPIWVTAEKMGKKTSFFYWPGCEVTIRGTPPTHCEKYVKVTLIPEFDYSLQQTINILQNNSADLIGIYLEAPDHYGHRFGVKSQNLTNILEAIDDSLHKFRQKLKTLNMEDDVNIMIFSDHGMTNVTKAVNITDVLDLEDIHVILPEVPYVSIWPLEGKLEKVYDKLQSANKPNITIFKKEDLPDSYFLKNHRRTAPIIIRADNGILIHAPWKCSECTNTVGDYKGMHGYDPNHTDMRAIFRATGPAFKKNFVNNPIKNIELYQIMCHILGIKPSPHNGTWSHVAGMLVKDDTSSGKSNEISTFAFIGLILVTCTIMAKAL